VRGLRKFWSLVVLPKGDGCWGWSGAVGKNGYATFVVDGESVLAHRFAYVMTFGDIPDELEIDHLCRNRGCARPSHLEAVTHRENLRRSPIQLSTINSAKTHCCHGHEFSRSNTRIDRKGYRLCRTCGRLHSQLAYLKRKQSALR
jgi:hypothetical protein